MARFCAGAGTRTGVRAADGRLSGFLADTWWFGLTQRVPEKAFQELAELRARQGFTAVQLVVGVPPEVGPENENAASDAGFPWTLDGAFNEAYLQLARERIQTLNQLGLMAIVYGAWGHQIEWLGRERMAAWQLRLMEKLDALNVIYCLTGESDLWVGAASRLLPAKTTDDLVQAKTLFNAVVEWLPPRIGQRLLATAVRVKARLNRPRLAARRRDWSFVLEQAAAHTNKPILIHTIRGQLSETAVTNPHLLAACATQTGHDENARHELWQTPLASLKKQPAKPYVNLEPWYEGILNRFGVADQLFAYWVSMLAGAASHCYGAQGIWNGGDGRFLAHWGPQTFAQAAALDTPRLLGLSHRQYRPWAAANGDTFFEMRGGKLLMIGRKFQTATIRFFPDVAQTNDVGDGRIWLPLAGRFTDNPPAAGPAVTLTAIP